jgi:hypothetical protein
MAYGNALDIEITSPERAGNTVEHTGTILY